MFIVSRILPQSWIKQKMMFQANIDRAILAS